MRKKKLKVHVSPKFSKGGIIVPLILIVIISFSVLLTNGGLVNKSAVSTEQYELQLNNAESGKKNLQLKNLSDKENPQPTVMVIDTPTPTPSPTPNAPCIGAC